MADKPLYRMFPYTSAELPQIGDSLVILLTRDQSLLAARGVTLADITALQAQIDDYKNFPSNQVMEALITDAISNRNAAYTEAKYTVTELRAMAIAAFGENSEEYKDFGFIGIFEVNDKAFIQRIKTLLEVIAARTEKMEDKGMTAAMLTQLEAERLALDAAADAVQTAKLNARVKTRERTQKGNELWVEIRDRVNLAKAYFRRGHELLAFEYGLLLEKESAPTNDTEAPSSIVYADGTVEVFFDEPVDEVQLSSSPDGNAPWTQIYSGAPQAIAVGTVVGVMHFRARGRKNTGAWSDYTEKIVASALSAPADIVNDNGVLRITPVVGAINYKIVYGPPDGNINSPENILVSDAPVYDYPWNPPAGTYNFYVQASADGIVSTWLVKEMTFV